MKLLKYLTYYISLAILASFAIDIVLDSWFNYVLYAVICYAVPLYGEFDDAVTYIIEVKQ